MSHGPTVGEMNTEIGILLRILKFILLFTIISTVILLETHLLVFSVTNLFVDSYDFQLKELKGHYIQNGYNNFLYLFSKFIASKMPYWANFGAISLIISVVYVSFYHAKQKRFPRVIISIIINNILIVLLIALLGKLLSALIGDFGVIICITPILYAVYLLKFKNRKKPSQTEKFTKVKEKSEKEDDGFTFKTNKGLISLDNAYRGIYVQGGAGSGKSASIFERIILQLSEKLFTGICYDFKGDLTEKVYLSYENSSIKVKTIDFKNPLLSDRVNAIHPQYLTKSAIAIEYAHVIISNLLPDSIKKQDFWSNNSKMILAGVIWYLRNEHPKCCTLAHTISLILHNSADDLIQKVSQDYEAGGMVASLRESITRGAERQVAGVLSTLQNALSTLNTPDIYWILSSNDVDLHLNNKKNPSFLCIINDSTLPTVYTPAISLIISVALRQMNQPNQQKSVVLLDEAPTVFLPNIEQLPATARSSKIATIFGVQDYAQLVQKYGEDISQVIISNLGNQFFGRTTNYKTAEMVQNLFSKKDEVFTSKSTGDGTSGKFVHLGSNTSSGTSENIQERNRVKISDIVNLAQGEFYGIIAEGNPREFLKTKFLKDEIKGKYINQKIPISESMMQENYFKIIAECKEIISS
ncbi:type IV secretory system conjugative DNA transfer family protein [Flavobacterium plurextorum]|uniref:type IV secretory system conjugative DNA transfer family protein n=1 Tax=Flavobacterium TaxID=237 RepID=UPI00214D2D9E|nr:MULTISPECIES: type IV secretion system DNA-binding domain-containing protein [Flavobacterium]UUW10216.1 type IV secretion system DNA-binding domain-containing protein [Flavobacterium plurextorum]